MWHRRPSFASRAALASFLVAAAAAQARPAAEPAPLDSLQAAYLACDRTSMRVVLGARAMQQCAEIGERLLQRDFDGDLDRMLAWRRLETERRTALVARTR